VVIFVAVLLFCWSVVILVLYPLYTKRKKRDKLLLSLLALRRRRNTIMSSSSSFRLTVCPFSLFVFIASAVYVTQAVKKRNTVNSRSVGNSKEKSKKKYQVVFVLGGPGSGKGTQCELLTKTRTGSGEQWAHLSAGDLLRAERLKGQGDLADTINHCISNGQLVPSHVTCQLLLNAMQELNSSRNITKFLIDGFPRSLGNLTAWDESEMKDLAVVEFCLFLDCPEEVMVGRLVKRGESSGRVDDQNLDVIRKRFQTYEQETAPIIEWYQTQGKLHTVAADQAVENVSRDVQALFVNL
jgi:UMP-CMP kinase